MGSKYVEFNDTPYDIWEFRGKQNHLTFTWKDFTISEREKEKQNGREHLKIYNDKLLLIAEDFYDDLKSACEKVITALETGKIEPKYNFISQTLPDKSLDIGK